MWTGHEAQAMTENANRSMTSSVERELITGSVVIAAIVLFIWTGGAAMTAVVRHLTGAGPSVEQILLTTLLLNIALILMGWRRYRDLQMEVQRRREAEERASSLAATDPLTGFLNRRSFGEMSESLLAQTEASGQSMVMMLLDLDNFKRVNDVHGHAAGDLVLIAAAQRIQALMPPGALTARLGGDEFACALAVEANVPETVHRIAERLVSSMTEPVTDGNLQLAVSTSIGIARSDRECRTLEALMRRADIAMYRAKRQGRDCYAWFDKSMEQELNMRGSLEAGIRRGIPNKEFVPFYEPQMELASKRLTGFEMLARWQNPVQGMISPEVFIPVAEESGLISDLSLDVMRQAFTDACGWDTGLTLSVNISPAQLKDVWLSQKLRKLLLETGLPANRLEVDITESALFENMTLAQAIVSSLKNQGIRIALDDFGTGYGSIAHLRALPFDRIKINREFVSSINQNSQSAAIVSTIARLGDSLGLPVTAEGIEDGAIEERLRQLGCKDGQGWHYGKPMPNDEVLILLAQQGLLAPAPAGGRASHPEMPRPHAANLDRKAI